MVGAGPCHCKAAIWHGNPCCAPHASVHAPRHLRTEGHGEVVLHHLGAPRQVGNLAEVAQLLAAAAVQAVKGVQQRRGRGIGAHRLAAAVGGGGGVSGSGTAGLQPHGAGGPQVSVQACNPILAARAAAAAPGCRAGACGEQRRARRHAQMHSAAAEIAWQRGCGQCAFDKLGAGVKQSRVQVCVAVGVGVLKSAAGEVGVISSSNSRRCATCQPAAARCAALPPSGAACSPILSLAALPCIHLHHSWGTLHRRGARWK